MNRRSRISSTVLAAVLAAVVAGGARADLYVTEQGDDSNPGTEAKPFLTVQAAVDAAPAAGCVIHVAAGTFYAKATVDVPDPVLTVEKPVTIIGAGVGKTILSGEDKARYLVKMNREGAVLRDMTICHAVYKNYVTGIGLKLTKGEVFNVVFEEITGYHLPGVEVSGGVLSNAVIRKIYSGTTPNSIGLSLSGSGYVSNCEICGLGKTSGMSGGMRAAGVTQSGGTLENCYIHDNAYGCITTESNQGSAFFDSYGVGLYMTGGRATGCRICRNWCIGHAAGAKVTGNAILENSVLFDNSATNIFSSVNGGGVTVDGANAIVRGCVIANNYAMRESGGLALYSGTVTNNYIFGHAVTNCYVKAGTFKDNFFYNPGISDLTTYARPAADAFSCHFTVDRDFIRGNNGGEVTFTAAAQNASGSVAYSWDFGDGGSGTGGEVKHTFAPGRHTVTLTATAGGKTAVCKTKDAITVYPQKVYVAKGKTPKFPYTSLDDAAAEIDDVTGLCPLEIEVGAGTYGLRDHGLHFAYPVKMTGAGRDATIVDGNNWGYSRGLVLDDPDAFVSGMQFYRNNLCTWDAGAGILLFNGTVSNCWVRKAKAYGNIGVDLHGGKLVDTLITECENGSSQRGLAASLRGGSLYGCVVSNNTTTGTMNGIIYMDNAASVVSNCTISCNQAGGATSTAGKGGAVSMSAGLVTHCRILENKSGVTGGGAYLTGGTLRNCLVAGNSVILTAGSTGGGVYNDGGTVENCTIVDNTATGTADGLHQKKGTTINTIVYNNAEDNLVSEGGTVTYSCMKPTVDGAGNTETAPAFVSAAKGDWRLTSLATAQIDMASPLDWITAAAVDLDGKARLVNEAPDMGCYEYAPSADEPFIVQFTASGTSGKAPVEASFTAIVSKHPVSECTFCWYFGDSATPEKVTGVATVSHTYTTAGSFTVRLVVEHGTGSSKESTDFETSSCVSVIPKTCYVAEKGGNVYPYDTWEKAATNLITAYDVKSDEIVISNGTYSSDTISFARPVTVRSLNGPEVTTLEAAEAAKGQPFVNITDGHAVLAGVAVSGNRADGYNEMGTKGGGSGISMSAGLVTNCVIRNCTHYDCGAVLLTGSARLVDSVVSNNNSWADAGYAGGILQRDAGTLVSGCLIAGNRAAPDNSGNSCGGAGAVVVNGTMTNCVLRGNYGERLNSKAALTVYDGLVTHCVITNNDLYAFAGGVWQKGGIVRNCLIAQNVTHGTRDDDGIGGLLLDGGTAESLTIVGNTSVRPGGGLRQNGGALVNTLVYGNTSPDDECWITDGVRSNCMSTVAMAGTHCLGGDPMLENFAAGDYRPSVLSKAKDAGVNQDWMDDAVDLVGFDRISGAKVDIGAYEADALAPIPLTVSFESTNSERLTDNTTRITFKPAVVGSSGTVTLTWDFGDGSALQQTGTQAVDHVFAPGAYTVKVKASDDATQETTEWVVRKDYAVAIPKVCYVAKGEGVESRYPYATPATGAATLYDALAAGSEEICILPGRYDEGQSLQIVRDVKIYSQSGNPNDTVVVSTMTADKSVLCSVNSSGVELRGITLSGGIYKSQSGDEGATLKLISGLVTDCILENGLAWGSGSVSVDGGTIRRSVIRGHKSYSGLPCDALRVNGGLVECCVITNNTHARNETESKEQAASVYFGGAEGKVHSCLIAYNNGYYGAGVRFGAGGELVNCTIVSNVAKFAYGGVSGTGQPSACRNNIVWGNVAPTDPDIPSNVLGYFTYSCSPVFTGGKGNITVDPRFVDPADGDWHVVNRSIEDCSPCVNGGGYLEWMSDAVDLDGQPRAKHVVIRKGVVKRAFVDMGCYESVYRSRGLTVLVY